VEDDSGDKRAVPPPARLAEGGEILECASGDTRAESLGQLVVPQGNMGLYLVLQ
jgi:hypothetical protein